MKLLVLSDSHSCGFYLEEILKKERSADAVIHLGDGADEMYMMTEYTSGKPLYICKGNCDSIAYGFPETQIFSLGSYKIFACHGHMYNARYTTDRLYYAAREEAADIILYGHTHTQLSEYSDGIYLFNPGAVKDGKYGIIEILDNHITPLVKSFC